MITRIKDALSDARIDFVGKRRVAAVLSTILVLASWALVFGVGPNWGIDFTGGTEIKLGFTEDVDIAEVRAALRELGLGDDAVQEMGGGAVVERDGELVELAEFDIRIQDASFGAKEIEASILSRLVAAYGEDWIDGEPVFDAEVGARLSVRYKGDPVLPAEVAEVLSDLDGVVVSEGRETNEIVVKMPGLPQLIQETIREAMDGREFEVLSVDAVGPKVGGDLRRQGFLAIAATLALVLLYVGFRFDVAFAPGAIVALFHDVSVTLGVFVLLQREVNLPMIGALLTIVGYSLNDTIVIYDRIRENMERYARTELTELINVSINETLGRTLATSVTTLLAIVAFLFMGGPVIQNFALAMLLGIVLGTYSTVYVASPGIIGMQAVKPWLQKLVAGAMPEEPEAALDEDEAGLTESEKRRRQRAALLREGDTG